MTDKTYLKISKDESNDVRWLQAGTSKHHRYALTGINVEGGIAVSANGFTLRIVPTPSVLKPHNGELVKLDKAPRSNGDIVEMESLGDDEEFPNWREIVPEGKPDYKIVVNAGLLAALIKDMGTIQLEFHAPTQPVVIKSKHRYGVLMPMFSVDDSEIFDPFNQPKQIDQSK